MATTNSQNLNEQLRTLAAEIAKTSGIDTDILTTLERTSALITNEPLASTLDQVCRRIRRDRIDPLEAILEHPDIFPTELRQAFDLWIKDGTTDHFSAWIAAQ